MTILLKLTADDFFRYYTPEHNYFASSCARNAEHLPGFFFETYGYEFTYVRCKDPAKVWTLIDGDDDNLYLVSGLRLVNRICYVVTTMPVPADLQIEVCLKPNE